VYPEVAGNRVQPAISEPSGRQTHLGNNDSQLLSKEKVCTVRRYIERFRFAFGIGSQRVYIDIGWWPIYQLEYREDDLQSVDTRHVD
jgi:hypothetical protein